MSNLGSTYWNQGRWNEAEWLEVQAMDMRIKLLGAEHPDTLTSMGNLASTYRNQGRWNEAEQLQVQVIDMSSALPARPALVKSQSQAVKPGLFGIHI